MYRLTFSGDEDLLDVVLPLLPGGVREDGDAYVGLLRRAVLPRRCCERDAAAWSTRCPPTGSGARWARAS